jgi:FkbM family methyltransferase
MTRPLREARLPDGTRVYCTRPYEVGPIHAEMPGYFRHGIRVRDGDIVFDVGANIGLFGLWVHSFGHHDVTVYSFEPIPAVFRALRANAARYDDGRWQVFNCGLGRESTTATFGYHRSMTVWSSPYPDDSPAEREMLRRAALHNLYAAPRPLCWLRWLPPFLRARLLDFGLAKAFRYRTVACPVRTISDVLRDKRVPRIDLLKVDVQRGEMDVFDGIAEYDWPKIGQVVAEVHDLHDGRVARIVDLLGMHGFDAITTEQEPLLCGTDIYNLYAQRTRSAVPARSASDGPEDRSLALPIGRRE